MDSNPNIVKCVGTNTRSMRHNDEQAIGEIQSSFYLSGMKHGLIFLCLLVSFLSYGQADPVYSVVESMPTPKSCSDYQEMERTRCTRTTVKSFIQEHLVYPKTALEKKLRGTAYVSFVVDEEGKVVMVELLKGVAEELDVEAIRVVTSLSTLEWIPGMQNGKEVKVRYNQPVVFNPPKPQPEIPAK